MTKLTHLDQTGAARMVDVSRKPVTDREATAEAIVVLSPEAYEVALSGAAPKGDVLSTARIAGIMAAKKTSELIPLCHPLPLAKVDIAFEPLPGRHALRIAATAKTTAQTGVEMEALTAASVAALTVYDMVKAIDHAAVIEGVRLLEKSGGKSGAFRAPVPKLPPSRPRAKPSTLIHETAAPLRRMHDAGAQREAFRAFMTAHRLRATEWAKQAGVPAAQIYSYLTGKSRALETATAEKLAKAARVRVEDLFGGKT